MSRTRAFSKRAISVQRPDDAEMEAVMRLYEFGPTRSIRARWTLQELGVGFEPITVNLVAGEHRRP